jgi:hypothetical protein
MPFPGESPTVALAMAAGEKYGLHEEAEKPAKKPKRAAASKKTATKKTATKKKVAKPARKPKATKATPAKKSR